MTAVTMPCPGVWLITCPTHGHIGAAIHMARDLADEIAAHHDHTHLEEESAPMPTPEHLPDDIAAAHKAADDLLDALHHIRRQYRLGATPPMVATAIEHAYAVWIATRIDFPALVQP